MAPLYSRALRRMSYAVFLTAASLALLFIACLPAINAAHAGAAPSIEISPNAYDFGQVRERTTIEHDFVIKNTGTAVLALTDVETG